jgi:ABC-type nitrate/sulfonate/bicarbonate transport system ATPase subunit
MASGAFVSFVGPSGRGKITLPRAAADWETPTRCPIRINGMSRGKR